MTTYDSDDDWEDGEVEDWDEPESAPTRCLFTAQEFASPAECLAHAASAHGLDVQEVISRLRLDLYGRMQLVNYLRTSVRKPGADAVALVAAINACEPGSPGAWPWADDAYLQPALADDPLLYSLVADEAEEEAEDQAEALEAVGTLHETVALMRQEMKAVLSGLEDAPGPEAPAAAAEPAAAAAEGPAEGEYGARGSAETSYFGSYSRVGIHEEMLRDRVRTESYRDAIAHNASLFAGKIVLDVGCGTGILSLFAARAGARLVIGVDASPIIESARKVVAANGLEDRIKLVQGTLETVALPLPEGVATVDVIVSEWMGYLLLYESMLPSVLFARDQWLAPGGLLLPSSCELRIAASGHDRLAFWRDVYGFDMRAVAEEARRAAAGDAAVEVLPAASLLSPSAPFRALHIAETRDHDLDFTAPFELTASAAGTLRCFAVHFDTCFDLAPAGGQSSRFSTGPESTPTHWKQVALYLDEGRELQPGDKLSGSISCARQAEYKRAYDVSVSFALNGVDCGTQLWHL